MKLYCDICNNLLEIDIMNDVLIFVCKSCQNRYEAKADDSLRYEEVKGSDIAIFSKILEKIADDPVNPKIYKDCKKCNHNISKYVRLGAENKIIFSCVNCKNITM